VFKTAQGIIETVAALATVVVAWLAYWTYRQRVKLERAKWVKELYEKFYERSDLKGVRDL
jgi:hypothetical protein